MATVIGNLAAAVEFIKNFFKMIMDFFAGLGDVSLEMPF